MRRAHEGVAAAGDRHVRDGRRRRSDAASAGARRRARPGRRGQPLRRPAGGVPRRRDPASERRLRHQDGAVAAGHVERQVQGDRQRRARRRHRRQRQRARGGRPARLRDGRPQHRPRGRLELRPRAPRAHQGLRLPRHARDDGDVEGAHPRVLRQAAVGVLHGRGRWRHDCGAQFGAALSRRLRHHRGNGHVVVPHAPHVRADVGLDGHAPGRRQLPHARQVCGAARCGARGMRRAAMA